MTQVRIGLDKWELARADLAAAARLEPAACGADVRRELRLLWERTASHDARDRRRYKAVFSGAHAIYAEKVRSTLHCIALHRIAVDCIALHCIALSCIALAMHCIASHCSAVQCSAVHCIALKCIAVHCSVLHCIALAKHCIASATMPLHWQCIALHCIGNGIALHWQWHCIALHCSALQCIPLHCIGIALHYVTLRYITGGDLLRDGTAPLLALPPAPYPPPAKGRGARQ